MLKYLNLLIIVILLGGCATFTKNIQQVPSYAVEPRVDTRIGKAVAHDAINHPGESGYYLLPSDMDAFVARAALIEGAQQSLDLQYYIISDDLTVNFLIERILSAADRGIRVRLLFDDLGAALDDSKLWLLNMHTNIEVRLFNPVHQRRKGIARILDIAGNLSQLNHRMHNKAFIADNTVGILGGRNLADEYFGAKEESNFADMDIMAAGPVVKDISKSFDIYWNSQWAVPFELLSSDKPDDKDLEKTFLSLKKSNTMAKDSKYAVSLRHSDFLNMLIKGSIPYSWAKGYVVYDQPEKISKASGKDSSVHLEEQLLPLAMKTRTELILISPYFVPGKTGVDIFGELKKQGMNVRIATNSLASTDVVSVHSGYAKYRKDLLKKGIELYEMRADADTKAREARSKVMGSYKGSLHAKVYIFDRKSIFVGSRNLDFRSRDINTEIGVYIESPEIAGQASGIFDKAIAPEYCFKLKLDENSHIIWTAEVDGKEVEYDHDPMTSSWRRFSAGFMSIFVPESLL
jgi:putative cardiolipin synthase